MLLENGKYISRSTERVVYETDQGALCVAIKCEVMEGEKTGTVVKSVQTIAKRDGTLQERTIATLKEVFGWDGTDPFWLMETDLSDKHFEIEIENQQDAQDPNKVYSSVKWLNPLGGGPGVKMPTPANKQSVLAKYGSRFRALAGGTPAKPATPPPPKAATPPPPPSGPTATMEQAWNALWEANPGITNEQATQTWQREIARLFPGKTNSDLTPQDWAALKEELSDSVPF